MEAPKPIRKRAPRRARGDAPKPDEDPARTGVRMYVSLPAELHRRFAMWCKWTGTTPSDVVRAHAEETLRGFVVHQRSGTQPEPVVVPIRPAAPEPEEADRRAG